MVLVNYKMLHLVSMMNGVIHKKTKFSDNRENNKQLGYHNILYSNFGHRD